MMPPNIPSMSTSSTAKSSAYSVFNAGAKYVGGSDLKPLLYIIIVGLVFLAWRGFR
ncbi:MAG: hypothetical protein HQ515_09455 [Phycisphaeraceae bacterium]|nr:hypothetical protein [Phycisphaeraceae bacterium]